MADLEDLRTFLTAVRAGSFAAAARQLNISPAMVGRRIQGLEARYRAKLIERTTRTQRLTDAGNEFMSRAEAVIEAAEALEGVSLANTLSGRLRVSAPTTLGSTRLPTIVAAFVAAHPGIVVEISLSDRRVDLVSEGFDLAIRIGHLHPSTLIARTVGTYDFVCCAEPAFLDQHGKPKNPTDIGNGRCVLNMNLTPRNRWLFSDLAGREVGVEVSGSIESDNDVFMRRVALDGYGIVYVPRDLVDADIAEGRLQDLFPDWNLRSLPIHAVHVSRRHVPRRVTAFIEAVAKGLRH